MFEYANSKLSRWLLTMLLGMLAFTACKVRRMKDSSLKIANGKVTTEYPAVMKIRLDGWAGASNCTGTAVSEKIIITAAHCVWDLKPNRVSVSYEREGETKTAVPTEIVLNPRYSNQLEQCRRYDVAALIFQDTKFPTVGVSYDEYAGEVTMVGYGGDGSSEGASFGVKREGNASLVSVDEGDLSFWAFLSRGDKWLLNLALTKRMYMSRGFLFPPESNPKSKIQSVSQAVTRPGDSGGPLFVNGQIRGTSWGSWSYYVERGAALSFHTKFSDPDNQAFVTAILKLGKANGTQHLRMKRQITEVFGSRKTIEKIIEENPDEMRFAAAKLYYNCALDAAQILWKYVLNKNRKDVGARVSLGALAFDKGDFKKAETLWLEQIRNFPEDHMGVAALASYYLYISQPIKAGKVINAFLVKRKGDWRQYVHLVLLMAMAHFDYGELWEAKTYLDIVWYMYPRHPQAVELLMYIYEEVGARPDDRLEQVSAELQREPSPFEFIEKVFIRSFEPETIEPIEPTAPPDCESQSMDYRVSTRVSVETSPLKDFDTNKLLQSVCVDVAKTCENNDEKLYRPMVEETYISRYCKSADNPSAELSENERESFVQKVKKTFGLNHP